MSEGPAMSLHRAIGGLPFQAATHHVFDQQWLYSVSKSIASLAASAVIGLALAKRVGIVKVASRTLRMLLDLLLAAGIVLGVMTVIAYLVQDSAHRSLTSGYVWYQWLALGVLLLVVVYVVALWGAAMRLTGKLRRVPTSTATRRYRGGAPTPGYRSRRHRIANVVFWILAAPIVARNVIAAVFDALLQAAAGSESANQPPPDAPRRAAARSTPFHQHTPSMHATGPHRSQRRTLSF